MTTDSQSRYLSFGELRLDCRSGELRKGKREIRLQPQPAKLLLLLASRPGEIVTRAEIQKALWGEDTFVDFEHGINFSIKQIRDALGDEAEKPRYIETVPRVGYRFVARAEAFGPDGGDERSPYPGLSSFSSSDSAFFFGREAEIESVRRKFENRQMLALIGPSGSGKSSFLRAGLLPSLPQGFRVVLFTPGTAPMRALIRALAPEVSGDAEAVQDLTENVVAAASRWRKRCEKALVVVDAFEELFTLNPPEVQREFASTTGRLAAEADVQVLLSMRDDFLFRCHDFVDLAPVFSDLTPLGPLKGPALRRPLEQPALAVGYRFETQELVEEMLREVEGERGALPLLAFTASQLWERRDREKKLLTRQAYEEAGRVAGALGRHAESTLEKIGASRQPVVRELFRNLVTAQGTRASREVSELLSVFPKEDDRRVAEEVLRELVSARLLTAYETWVEIIHESLLTAWPRLVRWRNEDEGGALLRDQLRQAAQMWQERGRPDDLLWTGKSFRELSLWHESYAGGLSTTEESFARAATGLSGRKRRRNRAALAALVTVVSSVAIVTSLLWRRSEEQARLARATGLAILAREQLDENNTVALAYATASLEITDRPETRRLALDALWRGPTFFSIPKSSYLGLDFSRDGQWLAAAGALWPADGGEPVPLEEADNTMEIAIGPRGDVVASQMDTERFTLGIWSVPGGRLLRKLHFEGTTLFHFSADGRRLITATDLFPDRRNVEMLIQAWPLDGGDPDLLANIERTSASRLMFARLDPSSTSLAWIDGEVLRLAPLEKGVLHPRPKASLKHPTPLTAAAFGSTGKRLATSDAQDTVRLWSLERDPPRLVEARKGDGGWNELYFDAADGRLATSNGLVWDLAVPTAYEPLRLMDQNFGFGVSFHPSGNWIATSESNRVSLWPISRAFPQIVRRHERPVNGLAFAPDGSFLVSCASDGSVRTWPLPDRREHPAALAYEKNGPNAVPRQLAMDPKARFAVVANFAGEVISVPLDGMPSRTLPAGFTDVVSSLAIDATGRFVAAGSGMFYKTQALVRVWDLDTEKVAILDAADGRLVRSLGFTSGGDLLESSGETQRLWNLTSRTFRVLSTGVSVDQFVLPPDGDQVLLLSKGALRAARLSGEGSRPLETHGTSVRSAAFDRTGNVVISGDEQGAIRVGRLDGEEPHLLLGHKGAVHSLAVSPDNRWIASGGEDGTIRLWPMPDLSKPPLHTLPYTELLTKLHQLTNLRVVPDEKSETGYRVEAGPFPGWKTLPSW